MRTTVRRAAVRGFRSIWLVSTFHLATRSGRSVRPIAWILSGAPIGGGLVSQLVGGPFRFHHLLPFYYLGAFSLLIFTALFMAYKLWLVALHASSAIDDMLASSTVAIGAFVLARQRFRNQLTAASVGAIGLSGFTIAVQQKLGSYLEFRPASYLAVAIGGAIAGTGLYWVETTIELSARVYRVQPLRVVWHSPAMTLGLVRMSHGYWLGSIAFAVPALAVEILSLQIPRRRLSDTLNSFVIAFPILIVLIAVAFIGIGHVYIGLTIRRSKLVTLAALDELIGDLRLYDPTDEWTANALKTYQQVADSPALPFRLGTTVPYAAALLAPLITFILTATLKS